MKFLLCNPNLLTFLYCSRFSACHVYPVKLLALCNPRSGAKQLHWAGVKFEVLKHFTRKGAYFTMVASYGLRVIHFKPYGLNFLFGSFITATERLSFRCFAIAN